MTNRKLEWYEFFAGGGLARLGLGSEWHCTFANDICKKKSAAYKAHFGASEELKVKDVRHLSVKDLPGNPDLVWASFPCQDLSLAGSGAGLRGERSGTFAPFWELIRGLIAEGRRPPLVVLENVTGAISSHDGKDFTSLIHAMAVEGYRVGPLVIDAVHFVPQSRPRLFLVAVHGQNPLPINLIANNGNGIWHSLSLVNAYQSLPPSLKEAWVWWNMPEPVDNKVASLSSLIEANPSGTHWHSKEQTNRLISLMSNINRRKLAMAQKEGVLKVGTLYKRTRPIGKTSKRKVQRAEVRFDEISGCLRTPVGGSSRQTILIVKGKSVRSRLLSPREAARLMGVPESYPIPAKYNDAYHVFGDGVAVPVVEWLEQHLLRPLAQRGRLEQVA